MGIFQNNLLAGAGGQAGGAAAFYDHQIEQSVRISGADSSYLKLATGDTSGNRVYWTLSFWVKKCGVGETAPQQLQGMFAAGNSNLTNSSGNSGVVLGWNFYKDSLYLNSQEINMINQSTEKRRDPSAWMHLVLSANNGAGIAYLNGVQEVSFNYDGGANTAWNSQNMFIGTRNTTNTDYFLEGYMAELMMISHSSDAAVLTPSSFGETKNGVWIPKDISGLSNQDFYLKFENASDLGNDSSGNNRDWTATNMGADHQVLDSPTFGS